MKKLFALLLALIMVFSMVACGAKETTTGTKTETKTETTEVKEEVKEEAAEEEEVAEEASALPEHLSHLSAALSEPVELYVYIQDITSVDVWNEVLGLFMETYPNITVELMDSQENYFSTILATGDMPDIINPGMSQQAMAMIDAGLIRDISDTYIYQSLPQTYIDAETYNGVCLGIPQGAAFSAIFYNQAILAECGWDAAPANFDELIQCLADVTAAGYNGMTFAGDKTTCCWMVYECILANSGLSSVADYENAFMDGTFDFAANTEATEKLQTLAQYIMPGTTANTEDDVVASMATGNTAMCVAGNWSCGEILAAIEESSGQPAIAGLPPFNDAGEQVWISVSPESTFAMSALDEGEAHNAARVLLYEFIWEHYDIQQNAHGTIPVHTSYPEDKLVLPEPMIPVVGEMGAAPGIKMGFNLWTNEFKNIACTALNDVYSGNSTAEAAVQQMNDILPTSYLNMG